ncbi:uncharacterized protein TRIADDRAFT_61835 [Trichoplax adhaerens]|uniref:RRM domain-containing protein n=1 Tax=Trichoplax adhaerens TaxID=10228 RepID=B3SC35_TRIAD|nr:hypothetical protein TRIADDRAFT_61835 [Trichoplax adhaerens]EDV19735.1 hypothetical protein TRIADDRAFT_61835 [Trichoplax adhaerens]|eukprot:XP_002117759.1 hypothetical protein TRIADDRAFT_61835 [Trichoplax adhaerens]
MSLTNPSEIVTSRSTIFVRNLPYDITETQFEQLFDDVGPIRSSFLVRDKGTKDECRGFGYVTFTLQEDAERATTLKKSIRGRHIQILLAQRKFDTNTKRKQNHDEIEEVNSSHLEAPVIKKSRSYSQLDNVQLENTISSIVSRANSGRTILIQNLSPDISRKRLYKRLRKKVDIEELKYPLPGSQLNVQIVSKIDKTQSKKSLNKAKIIVRNLCFNCRERDLKEIFSQFGNVITVNIPPKGGFAFIQFENVFHAANAIKELNMTEVMNRRISLDWALPKSLYLKNTAENSKEHEGEKVTSDNCDSDLTDSDCEAVAKTDSANTTENAEEETKRNRHEIKEDVQEGKTLFIRNLSFDCKEDELKEFFSKFGKIRYCKIVIDRANDYSRGVAFVKYVEKGSADKCLESYNNGDYDFTLHDRKLIICRAVSRTDACNFSVTKPSKDQDKRNLYLASEGVITADSAAAGGLSKSDLKKRAMTEMKNKAKLKNPNYFVSKTRLCIRNIPIQVSDADLKKVIISSVDEKRPVRIKKVTIMRDRNRINSHGIAKSRGFGFMELLNHDDALKILRAINNNPHIFGSEKRLIVGFAIENQRALQKKKLRQERSKTKLQVRQNHRIPTNIETDNYGNNERVNLRISANKIENQTKLKTRPNFKGLKDESSFINQVLPSTSDVNVNINDRHNIGGSFSSGASADARVSKFSNKKRTYDHSRKTIKHNLLRRKSKSKKEKPLNELIRKPKVKI